MCLQAALLSAPIMSTYVLASDTSPPTPQASVFTLHASLPSRLPTANPRTPSSFRSSHLNLLYCSFGQLLTEPETISAPGLHLPICAVLSVTCKRADWEEASAFTVHVHSHSAFWSEVMEDMVYLLALQCATQQGPRDVVSPKLVYEAVPSKKKKKKESFIFCLFAFFFLISFSNSTKAERNTEQGREC